MRRGPQWGLRATVFNIAICLATIATAGVDDAAPPLGQSVRLDHPSVGCRTPDALMRIVVVAGVRGDEAMLAGLQAEDCRMFTTLHGEITDRQGNMVCVLGLGNSRCLWFVRTAFALAKPF